MSFSELMLLSTDMIMDKWKFCSVALIVVVTQSSLLAQFAEADNLRIHTTFRKVL